VFGCSVAAPTAGCRVDSETPLADALAKPISESPLHAELGVVATRDGVGVAAGISGPLGKGVSVDAQASWQQKSGWRMEAIVRWTKGK
jgi:hypothetical protein